VLLAHRDSETLEVRRSSLNSGLLARSTDAKTLNACGRRARRLEDISLIHHHRSVEPDFVPLAEVDFFSRSARFDQQMTGIFRRSSGGAGGLALMTGI